MGKKKYKIKIEYETEVYAKDTEEALNKFWDSQSYPQHDLGTFIDENTTIEEIEIDELSEIVEEKIKRIEDGKKEIRRS